MNINTRKVFFWFFWSVWFKLVFWCFKKNVGQGGGTHHDWQSHLRWGGLLYGWCRCYDALKRPQQREMAALVSGICFIFKLWEEVDTCRPSLFTSRCEMKRTERQVYTAASQLFVAQWWLAMLSSYTEKESVSWKKSDCIFRSSVELRDEQAMMEDFSYLLVSSIVPLTRDSLHTARSNRRVFVM